MMGPRGHGFHPYGAPRGAMRGQRGAFMSYPGSTVENIGFNTMSCFFPIREEVREKNVFIGPRCPWGPIYGSKV